MRCGEVFDSLFAFRLFKTAGDTDFFAPELLKIFEVFMREEVRHVVFFRNGAVYRDWSESWRRPWFVFVAHSPFRAGP